MNGSTSPSGRFEITISAWEARMSLWIETPTLRDTATGETLLSFEDGNWSLDAADWRSGSVVALDLRKYPGNHRPSSVVATVDCVARMAEVAGETVPLNRLEGALEKSLTWYSNSQ
jgi:hypothetical protein